MSHLSCEFFFDLSSFEHRCLFEEDKPVWNSLKKLKEYIDLLSLGDINCKIPNLTILKNPESISIGIGTVIEPGVYIQGPCVIGRNCEIRQGSYVRPYVLIGDGCVIGHATEAKHAIFLNKAKAPHFNYVGDSIIGNNVNMGAGVICANFRLDNKAVSVQLGKEKLYSGLKKFGAIIGDGSQIGCNSTLNPGVLLRKKTMIRPCTSVSKSNVRRGVPNV